MRDWKLEPARDLDLSPGERLRSLTRERGLVSTTAHALWGVVNRAYLRVFHRFEVDGRENVPREPPFVLVANHSSHLDALVLAAILPRRLRSCIFPIAAGDTFFETPQRALFAALFLNALPMWRRSCGSHALKTLRERLVQEPCAYILFPEGTRSRNGELGSFKSGLGMVVAGSSVPVIPCSIAGTYEALPSHRRLPRPKKITLRIGPPLVFENVDNVRVGWRAIASDVAAAVRGLSERL